LKPVWRKIERYSGEETDEVERTEMYGGEPEISDELLA